MPSLLVSPEAPQVVAQVAARRLAEVRRSMVVVVVGTETLPGACVEPPSEREPGGSSTGPESTTSRCSDCSAVRSSTSSRSLSTAVRLISSSAPRFLL
jgi:hypothetical protein